MNISVSLEYFCCCFKKACTTFCITFKKKLRFIYLPSIIEKCKFWMTSLYGFTNSKCLVGLDFLMEQSASFDFSISSLTAAEVKCPHLPACLFIQRRQRKWEINLSSSQSSKLVVKIRKTVDEWIVNIYLGTLSYKHIKAWYMHKNICTIIAHQI